MNRYLVFIVYYLYCMIIVIGTAYVVFGLNRSVWWWILALILMDSVKP
jgi:hypothetical protein